MRLIKFIAFNILFSTVAFTCNAQGEEKVTVRSNTGTGIFKLTYKTIGKGTVKVSIFDSKNQSVFTETVTTGSFSRPYNLSDQGNGDFKIVVEDKDGKVEKTVSYSTKKVESIIDVSKIANAPNKYLLSIENKDADQILVRILDSQKNAIHEQSFTVNGKFEVVFNLTKVKTNPVFEVMGNNGVTKTFSF